MTERHKHNQLKYTQQHLANERTYLAWIRTAVAVIGIGFLTASLHFTSRDSNLPFSDITALSLGVLSGVFGIIIIVFATVSYMRKKRQIEKGIFYSYHYSVIVMSSILVLMAVIAMVYFLLQWWQL